MKLRLTGRDTLLAAAVAALIKQRFADAVVEYERCGADASSCVSVRLDGSDRWMFVSADRSPGEELATALSDGACSAITIDSSPGEFDLAMAALVDGGQGYVPLDLARWMAGAALGRGATSQPSLTGREREVLQLVARGYSNSEIAAELMISANTVRTHLHALSVKLEAGSRTRMLANARALGIAEAFEAVPAGVRVPA